MHIELVATDGKIQNRLLWIDFTSNGVYAGYCIKGGTFYNSYHSDGNYFANWIDEKPKKLATHLPLNSFKGTFQLFYTYFRGVTPFPSKKYNLKKYDSVVTVDVRNYPNGVGCSVILLEPDNYALLEQVAKSVPKNLVTEIHTFLQCKPWLSIILHDVKNKPSGDEISQQEKN